MKRQLLGILILACSLTAFGAGTSNEIKDLKKELKNKVKIGTVQNNTIRNDNDEKIEKISFYSNRDENCDVKFRMRVTIELTDNRGKGNVYYASLTRPHKGSGEYFTGLEKWEFQIPHNDMEKPKITACAVQSGILHNNKFLPISEDLDDVDSSEEITKRENSKRIEMKCTYHQPEYWEH